MNNSIAIVVTAFNRPNSLRRLLNSLANAEYKNYNNIPLIISIDKSSDLVLHHEVVNIAKDFEWKFGEKKVNIEERNLGLKKHILKCGDYTNQYENIIVLEDDLYVSKYYFDFAIKALNFYKNDEKIAGISLYNHQINISCNRPFHPLDDGSSVYFLQYAQSWGQVWSRKMWSDFKKWLSNCKDNFEICDYIPENVCKWPQTSWLKYHIRYIIEKDLYFVYPRISLTTNFTDSGTHNKNSNTDYQVEIQYLLNTDFNFICFENSLAVYDAFFENIKLHSLLNLESSLTIDLYGNKRFYNSEYLLSTRVYKDYEVIKSFGLKLRPHELNILEKVEGNDVFLYKIKSPRFVKLTQKERLKIGLYDLKGVNIHNLIQVVLYHLKHILLYKFFNR